MTVVKRQELVEDYDAGIEFEEGCTNSDYGIVLDAEGDLKMIVFPKDYYMLPDKVKAVLALFGIIDAEQLAILFNQ